MVSYRYCYDANLSKAAIKVVDIGAYDNRSIEMPSPSCQSLLPERTSKKSLEKARYLTVGCVGVAEGDQEPLRNLLAAPVGDVIEVRLVCNEIRRHERQLD